jgi:hypothetical protein
MYDLVEVMEMAKQMPQDQTKSFGKFLWEREQWDSGCYGYITRGGSSEPYRFDKSKNRYRADEQSTTLHSYLIQATNSASSLRK